MTGSDSDTEAVNTPADPAPRPYPAPADPGDMEDMEDKDAAIGPRAETGSASSVPDAEPVLELKGLTKFFNLMKSGKLVGRVEAVKRLDLIVPRGSIFGFLGPNGAGKTTTIMCACGMLAPDVGTVTVAGHDMASDPSVAKARIGYLPEAVGLYPELNALQTLAYYGSFYDLDKGRLNTRAVELLELFGLADRATEQVAGYSLGMRKRLALAAALLHEPDLLILDEPTSGLDPQGVRALREVLRELNRQGLTIFFSSHVLSEVAQICDNVAILNQGDLVAQGTVTELQDRLTGLKPRVEVHLRNLTPTLESALRALPEVEGLQTRPLEQGLFEMELILTNEITPVINQILVEQGALVYKLAGKDASLEELFMAYTEEDPATPHALPPDGSDNRPEKTTPIGSSPGGDTDE